MGHPDLGTSDDIDAAPEHYALWVVRELMKGRPMAVNEYAELVTLHKTVQGSYLNLCTRGAPKLLLANFERYLEDLDALTPQPAPAGPPTPGLSTPAASGMTALPGG
jgi:hypothetical protein